MKPEPLTKRHIIQDKDRGESVIYYVDNVKSAVEWLKEWELVTIKPMIICDTCKKMICIGYKKKERIICRDCLYKKAFEDVMK